jgi:hypothetical protein
MSADKPDRILKALKLNLDAFFEGHDIASEHRYDYLSTLLKGQAPPEPEKPKKPRKPAKPYVSRVKHAEPGAIDRIWAAHEKKTHKP